MLRIKYDPSYRPLRPVPIVEWMDEIIVLHDNQPTSHENVKWLLSLPLKHLSCSIQEIPSVEIDQAILSCISRGQIKHLTISGWIPVRHSFEDLFELSERIIRSSLTHMNYVDIRRDEEIVCHADDNFGMDTAGIVNQFLLCRFVDIADNTFFLYNGLPPHFEMLARSLPIRCPEALMLTQSEGLVIPYESWRPLDAVMSQCPLSFLSFRGGQPTHMTLSKYRIEQLTLLWLSDAMCDELSESKHISRLSLMPSIEDTSFSNLGNALTTSGVTSLSIQYSVPYRYRLFPSLDGNEVLKELYLGTVTQKELDELMMYLSFNHSIRSVRCRVEDEINIESILDMIQLNDTISTLEIEGIDFEQEEVVTEQIRSFSPSIYQWNDIHFAFMDEPSPEAWLETPEFPIRMGDVESNKDTVNYQRWKAYKRKEIRDKRVAFYSVVLRKYEDAPPIQGEHALIQSLAQRLPQDLYGELFSFLAGKRYKKSKKSRRPKRFTRSNTFKQTSKK